MACKTGVKDFEQHRPAAPLVISVCFIGSDLGLFFLAAANGIGVDGPLVHLLAARQFGRADAFAAGDLAA
jgi:hypothetical protein